MIHIFVLSARTAFTLHQAALIIACSTILNIFVQWVMQNLCCTHFKSFVFNNLTIVDSKWIINLSLYFQC